VLHGCGHGHRFVDVVIRGITCRELHGWFHDDEWERASHSENRAVTPAHQANASRWTSISRDSTPTRRPRMQAAHSGYQSAHIHKDDDEWEFTTRIFRLISA
jgi:hypothetical protein